MEEVVFTINGREYQARSKHIPLDTSLNTFIRNHAVLFGTKFMCLEGGCGACNVVVTERHPVTHEVKTFTVNSCLVPIYSCHGLDITTVEGVGNKDQYDKTQTRLVLSNGVQCGYCSPGMVMSMYGLLKSKNDSVTMEEVEKAFGGNICRCTGYRPILEGYKTLASDASSKMSAACKDIEDLKICKKTGSKCKDGCSITKRGVLNGNIKLSFSTNQQWNRVSSVNEIFQIFNTIGDAKYMLISGNTAHGVYRRDADIQNFIDISHIEQLRSHSSLADLEIGANMTLTEIMELFNLVGSTKPEFSYLLEINKHFEQVANLPVRNIATIAGNLMMKHAHHDFESDLFLILDVIGATLTIAEPGNILPTVQLGDFLRVDMKKRVITKIMIPARSNAYVYRSYKISPRAQNSAAYVNAAFLFEFNAAKTLVQSARIGFGGINANFTRATATELFVVGKNIFNNGTLQEALQKLSDEIEPEFQPSQSSAEYRKKLALSLFYRFVLNTSPTGMVTSRHTSGGSLLERGLSKGSQSFQTQPERYPLSISMHRVDGFVQAGGETPFSNDLPPQPNELWAAIVHATKVHATIGTIDASAALAINGVEAFYSASDIPGLNSFTATQLSGLDYNEKIFENEQVIYHGQPVGVILAETQSLAEHAATLVQISYTNVSTSPVLTTIQAVFDANATDRIIDRSEFSFNRSVEGTDVVEHNIKGTFEVGSQFHFTLEPQTCIATPSEDGLNIWVSTQWMNLICVAVSQCTNIPQNRLTIECRRIGGGFGGKQSRSSYAACVAALSCLLSKRPVRVVLTIESNMKALGKRYPCYGEYDVHVNARGKIQKLYKKYYSDHGCTLNDPIETLVTQWFQNCYDPRTFTIEANAIKTDAPSNTFMRGPGTCEGLAMIENIMEHIAFRTGIDPIDVRLANMVDDHQIKLKFPEFLVWCEYAQRKAAVASFNAANRWKKRGLAVVPMQYPQNFFGHFPALVSIYHADGTVAISHGGIEMGQGVSTKACQVAAHTLGIPVQKIAIKPTNNLISPNSEVSGGSIVSASVCYAVLKACEELNEKIRPVRDEFPDASWEEITLICNQRSISLSSLYFQTFKELTNYLVYGISCAEVEVDILSGSFNITRVDILEDVGESISPLMDVGQVEGAFIQGLGMWLSEQLIYGPDGELLTNRTWNYHPLGARDIPVDIRIQFVKDSPNPDSVFRTKIAGEPPICMSVVAMYALRNALISARQDAGLSDVWFDIKAPYTVEKVFLNAANNYTQFSL